MRKIIIFIVLTINLFIFSCQLSFSQDFVLKNNMKMIENNENIKKFVDKYVIEYGVEKYSEYTIIITDSNYSMFPQLIDSSSQIMGLLIANSSFTKLPYNITKWNKLGGIKILGHNPDSLPKLLKSLSSVDTIEYIALYNTKIDTLPKEINLFKYLQSLDLNNIDTLNIEYNLPPNLEILYFWGGKLLSFGEYFHDSSITNISLDIELMEKIPKNIDRLSKLRYIGIFGDHSKNINFDFTSLKELSQIKSLDTFVIIMVNLSKIGIPEEIFEIKSLKHLDCTYDSLSIINKDIVKLENLESLWLSKNQISEIPKEIFSLKKLKELCIDDNKISFFPKITDVEDNNLRNISIMNNSLTWEGLINIGTWRNKARIRY